MALKFTSTSQSTKYVNVLVYGEAGTGKTTLCSTAPRPLIISAEAGLMALQHLDIPVLEIKKRSDVNEIYDWLSMSKEAKRFHTICLDSLSEIAEVLLDDELKANKDGRAAYGVMASEMNILTRGFRDLPFHVYFAAKSKKTIEESTGITSWGPLIPGQSFSNNMPYLFDELLRLDYFKHDKVTYRGLYTTGDRRYAAKDRSGRLSPIEKPDLTHIFNKVLNTNADAESTNANAEAQQEKKEDDITSK